MSRLFQPTDSVAKTDPMDCTSSRLMRGTQTSDGIQLSLYLRKAGDELRRCNESLSGCLLDGC